MTLYVVGWLILMVLVYVVGLRWFDAHQRAHNEWRPRSTRWLLWYNARELRVMLRAPWHRDADPGVEKARRLYLAVLAVSVAYLVLGFPLAVWLLA